MFLGFSLSHIGPVKILFRWIVHPLPPTVTHWLCGKAKFYWMSSFKKKKSILVIVKMCLIFFSFFVETCCSLTASHFRIIPPHNFTPQIVALSGRRPADTRCRRQLRRAAKTPRRSRSRKLSLCSQKRIRCECAGGKKKF